MGCIIYLFVRDTTATAAKGWIGGACMAALFVVPLFVAENSIQASVGLALSGLAIYFLAAGSGPVVAGMGSRWMEYGGRISFSVYLVHMPLQLVLGAFSLDRFAGLPLVARLALALLVLALPVAAGAAAYHLVERPAQKYLVGLYRRPSGRRVAEPVR
jgi:peptidoglycan/LPS O-acetylase OafA/YrhL